MRVQDALWVEGSDELRILCYGIFACATADVAFESLDSHERTHHLFRLYDDGWPFVVLLSESTVANDSPVAAIAENALAQMMRAEGCLAAFCMFDGAFAGHSEIFGPRLAEETYAFSFQRGSEVVNLDPDLLSSTVWKLVMARCRAYLDEKIEGLRVT